LPGDKDKSLIIKVEVFGRGIQDFRNTTGDKRALEAIHDFLRFQIKQHRTGKPLEIR